MFLKIIHISKGQVQDAYQYLKWNQGRIQGGGETRETGTPLNWTPKTFDDNLVFILHFILNSS